MRRRTARWLGWTIAAAGLVWVFHGVSLRAALGGVARVSWPLAAAAVAVDLAAYVCQGARWRILLAPWGRIRTRETTRAVYAGLFVNEILPLRVGEVARAWLVARRLGTDLVTVLATVAAERVIDGAWWALAIGTLALAVPLPTNVERGADLLGGIVLVAVVVWALLVRARRRPADATAAAAGAVRPGRFPAFRAGLSRVAAALEATGSPRRLALAAAVSVGIPLFQMTAFWLAVEAYGIRIGPLAAAAVLAIVVVGTAIPNAPGNVGSWQLFAVLGLGLFGVDKTTAAGFSVVAFVVLTIPLWTIGAWALATSGASLDEIRRKATPGPG